MLDQSLFTVVLLFSGLCAGDNGTSLHELFFKAIEETHFVKCIRLLNATHQIGCSGNYDYIMPLYTNGIDSLASRIRTIPVVHSVETIPYSRDI